MLEKIKAKIAEHEKQLKATQEQIQVLTVNAQRLTGAIIALKDTIKEEEEVC